MRLSRKQQAVLDLLTIAGDDVQNEGNVIDDLWPLIQQPRHVCRALERKGLLTFGAWNDEVGFDLHLTLAARDHASV